MVVYDINFMTYVVNCVIKNDFIEHHVSWLERKQIDFYLSIFGRILFPNKHKEYHLLYLLFEKEKQEILKHNLHKSYLSACNLRTLIDSPPNSISDSDTTVSSCGSDLLYRIPNDPFDDIDQV